MRRRDFIEGIGVSSAWPLAARAQQSDQMRRVGVMMAFAEDDPEALLRVTTLRKELLKLGWTEGRNIRFEQHRSGTDPEAISRVAREIVDTRPDVILADSTPPTYLFNPPTAPFAQRFLEPLKGAASSIGVEVVASPVHDPAEVETGIAGFAREPDGGLLVLPSTFMLVHRDLIIGSAERYRLPAIYAFRYFAESGGLISYGSVPADAYRQAATYIDQILRGAKPGDLPVQMSVKFELAVNLKTAKAMGLKIPESFLVRADEVIE
jgi:ABC-type uncharacterized transport system substrate-binding protein